MLIVFTGNVWYTCHMNTTENEARKDYCAPMHTAEHILNQTMIRMFHCKRSFNAHIEAKKSKCDYYLDTEPTQEEYEKIVQYVNEVISRNLAVSERFVSREEAREIVDLSKLPENAGNTMRIIDVGNYDSCACIGNHVANTSELGKFTIISHDYADGKLRLRWKLLT